MILAYCVYIYASGLFFPFYPVCNHSYTKAMVMKLDELVFYVFVGIFTFRPCTEGLYISKVVGANDE